MGSLSPSEVAVEGPFSHEFVHTRGVRLHAATAGDPTDPLILLLHDHTGGWFDYIHSISPLAAAGFHVAALDMRGFGMSDKPPSGYGIRYAVGDVAGVIQSLGHKRAHIVGCGSGGAVAWTLAANYPEHTLSLTSMCAADPSDYRQLQRTRPWLLLLDARPFRTPFTGSAASPTPVSTTQNCLPKLPTCAPKVPTLPMLMMPCAETPDSGPHVCR